MMPLARAESRSAISSGGAPYGGQPYFVSEYGGIWWNPGQQDTQAWGYGGEGRPKSPQGSGPLPRPDRDVAAEPAHVRVLLLRSSMILSKK